MAPWRAVLRPIRQRRVGIAALAVIALLAPILYCLSPAHDSTSTPPSHHVATANYQPPQADHDHIGQPAHQVLCHATVGVLSDLASAHLPRSGWVAPLLVVTIGASLALSAATGRAPPSPRPRIHGGRTVLLHLCVSRR